MVSFSGNHRINGLREGIRGIPVWGLVALLVIPAIIAFRLAIGGSALAQSPDWPTPPPGPSFPVPSAQALEATVTTPVEASGGQVAIVPVSWPGSLPLMPPLPSSEPTFEHSGIGPVTFRIDAGTFAETAQLRFLPRTAPVQPRAGHVLAAFELAAFDVEGSRLEEPLARPIRLSIPTSLWLAAGVEPSRVLGAFVDDDELRLIATEFDLRGEQITLRLVSLGTVLLIAETPQSAG